MVVDPGFRVFVGSVVGGSISCDLPVSGCSWGMRVNGGGSVEATVRTLSAELQGKDLRNLTAKKRQYLAVSYEGRILEAGPIWKRKYNAAKGELKLSAGDLWSLLDKVKLLNWAQIVAGTPVTRSSIDLTGLELGSIAREMVRAAVFGNPYNPGLPLVLPDVLATGTNERHYKGYELGYLGDRLKKLTEVEDGPDLAFRPRFNGADPTRIEWAMTHGTEASPLLYQGGDDWIWDATVEESGVSSIDVDEDGTGMADRVWQPGAGSELDMKLATAQDTTLITTAGYPWTETDAASKDVEDLGILQSYANAAMTAARRPVETWSLNVRADTSPRLGEYEPGDFAQITVPTGHALLVPGPRRVRIMAIDGDDTQTVKLTPAPMPSGV